MKTKNKESQIAKLYDKYEYLCGIYSRKLYDMESISLDREDILQEFKTKLFEVIVKYIKQFAKFRRGERDRPIQIEPYLRFSMSNLVNDFIKKSNTQKHGGWSTYVSIERDSFDFSNGGDIGNLSSVLANFKIKDYREDSLFELNGVDILEGLESREHRLSVILYLKGYKIGIIDKLLKVKSGKVIKDHINKLRSNSNLVGSDSHSPVIMYNTIED